MKKVAVFVWLLLVTVLTVPLPQVHAQSIENTLSAEPAGLEFSLNDDETVSEIVTITNQYDSAINMTAEFKAIDSVTGSIIPSGALEADVASSLKLSETEFTIPARSKYFLTVSVTDTQQLPSGGRYASLLLSDITEGRESSAIKAQLSLGVFIIKKQGAVLKVALSSHSFPRSSFQFPAVGKVEFLNDGNVHLTPRGYVRIYDKNEVYYESILNSISDVILPTQRHVEDLKIPAIVRRLPKRVTLEVGYRADGLDETMIYKEQFWYVPKYLIPLAGSTLFIIAIGIGLLVRRKKTIKGTLNTELTS